MTLREALKTVDLTQVYTIINARDQENAAECDRPSVAQTEFAYSRVVKELLGKPTVRSYSMPFCVEDSEDPFDGTVYLAVYLRNTRYVAPPKKAKPYGGMRGKPIPKGYYNINLAKHNLRYSIMGVRWSKLIDTKIELRTEKSLEHVVAALLWELTFDGWTEEKAQEKTEFIKQRLAEARKQIKEGKCVTLQPKAKGGMKIVIPDSVNQEIMDLVNKKKK